MKVIPMCFGVTCTLVYGRSPPRVSGDEVSVASDDKNAAVAEWKALKCADMRDLPREVIGT
jgi:hypothetical protein